MSDHIPMRYLDAAARLIGAVHEEGATEVAAALDGVDLRGLCVTLAALVPDDRTFTELLAWNDSRYEPAPVPSRMAAVRRLTVVA